MRTIKLTLQYDGTRYAGWQRQNNGRSIQGELEAAVARIEGRPVTVTGAGRTDAGVHALGQVASVPLEHAIDVESLRRALNAILPPDIRVIDAAETASSFHARYGARSKTYRYRILNGPSATPFDQRYAWHIPRPLNYERMAAAVGPLRGRHDFAAFQAAGSSVRTTVRTILGIRTERLPIDAFWYGTEALAGTSLLTFEITGDGFLRHMVRSIVGTLVEIGDGRRASASVERILASGDRRQAGPTAPAHGLFLVRVDY